MTDWRDRISASLTPAVRTALQNIPQDAADGATELRLRAERPVVITGRTQVRLSAPPPSAEDIQAMAGAMLGHAAHARQEELRQGFVTLPGGFRAGLCGRAVVKDGHLTGLQDIASIAVRVARAMPGAADALLPWILDADRPRSTLIVSPPGLGKTTMLRDAAAQLSAKGFSVAVVDERSELAACAAGVPTLPVGDSTDVLDGCPKAEGMRLVLRAMAPEVIVTDELGRPEDALAVREAARCGVAVIASAHGRSYSEAAARPMLRAVFAAGVFDRIVALSAIGRIGPVYDGGGKRLG